MAIHGARLPTRATKRLERYAIEVAHASPTGSTSSSTTRTAPSSCSSVHSAGAVEMFDLFDQADADPVASTAALVEQLAVLEQRLSLLEAKSLQENFAVAVPTEAGLSAADFSGYQAFLGTGEGDEGLNGRNGQDAVFFVDRIAALEHSLVALETQQQTLLILAEAQRQQLSSLKKDFEIQVGAEAIRGS